MTDRRSACCNTHAERLEDVSDNTRLAAGLVDLAVPTATAARVAALPAWLPAFAHRPNAARGSPIPRLDSLSSDR